MPRRKYKSSIAPPAPRLQGLAGALAAELKSDRESGQPLVYERELRGGKLKILVLWDRWGGVEYNDRYRVITEAYRIAFGAEFSDRIYLADGETLLDGLASGLLPFRILPALRRDDPVSSTECHDAMIEEGASTLELIGEPLLAFATEEEAEACRRRLVDRLPESESVWVIMREVGRGPDAFEIEDD